jgi:hypothetical protein
MEAVGDRPPMRSRGLSTYWVRAFAQPLGLVTGLGRTPPIRAADPTQMACNASQVVLTLTVGGRKLQSSRGGNENSVGVFVPQFGQVQEYPVS